MVVELRVLLLGLSGRSWGVVGILLNLSAQDNLITVRRIHTIGIFCSSEFSIGIPFCETGVVFDSDF